MIFILMLTWKNVNYVLKELPLIPKFINVNQFKSIISQILTMTPILLMGVLVKENGNIYIINQNKIIQVYKIVYNLLHIIMVFNVLTVHLNSLFLIYIIKIVLHVLVTAPMIKIIINVWHFLDNPCNQQLKRWRLML